MDLLALLDTPGKRAVAAGLGLTAFLWYAKPTQFFDADGNPKTASWLADPRVQAATTEVPWYIVVLGVTTAVDLFG